MPNVLAITASLRDNSVNYLLLLEALRILEEYGIRPKHLRMRDDNIPLYHPDDEIKNGLPEAALRFREALLGSDWILIASPENNASMSAALKNAIDWASRDKGQPSRAAFEKKKWVLISASPGPKGGANGLKHLRDSLTILRGEVLPYTFSLPSAYTAFDENGHLRDAAQKEALREVLRSAFAPLL